MVAALLDLEEGAGAAGEAVDQMARGLAQRHDVADQHPRRRERPARRGAARARPRASRRCRSPGRPRPSRHSAPASICALQPVTRMRAAGRSRRARRIAWRAWRSASAVTAQVWTMTTSSRPAAAAWPRITSDSSVLRRQPKVITSGARAGGDSRRRHRQELRVQPPLEAVARRPGHQDPLGLVPGDPQGAAIEHAPRPRARSGRAAPPPPGRRRRRCRRPG